MMTKRQHDRIGREIGEADLLGDPDDDRAERRAGNRAHAADDHDDQGREQKPRVLARRERLERAADDARDTGETRSEREDDHKDELDAHAHRREHVAIVDAGAHHHADARAIEHKPHGEADHDRSGEDDQSDDRIGEIDRSRPKT